MDSTVYRVFGGLGSVLILVAFVLGILFQVNVAWLLLLAGAFLLAYAIYCGSRPFLRQKFD